MDLFGIRVQYAITFDVRNQILEVVMKNAKWMVVGMMLVLASLAAAQLGGAGRIVAQVPFEYVAGNKVVPAGECVVQTLSQSGLTLTTFMISNAGAKVSLLSPASRQDAREAAAHYALVFNRQGSQYFLRGIKIEGSRIAYRLPESKAEAELRARNVPASEQIVLASLK